MADIGLRLGFLPLIRRRKQYSPDHRWETPQAPPA